MIAQLLLLLGRNQEAFDVLAAQINDSAPPLLKLQFHVLRAKALISESKSEEATENLKTALLLVKQSSVMDPTLTDQWTRWSEDAVYRMSLMKVRQKYAFALACLLFFALQRLT